MKKRILFYCQSLLGIGHFTRSRELLYALRDFEVRFLYGGEFVPGFELPDGVESTYLPALRSDAKFQRLYSVDGSDDLQGIQSRRKRLLLDAFDEFAPDVLLIEQFPFGRKKFNFELMPLLAHARAARPGTKIVCSLRDILVRRPDQARYEADVRALVDEYFDLLLIHSDPRLQRLEETFGSADALNCSVRYTGYVAQPARPQPLEEGGPGAAGETREESGPLLLVSIGGGRVGRELIDCVLDADARLTIPRRIRIFTGPLIPDEQFQGLQGRVAGLPYVTLRRHTTRFLNWLRHADLSISMAGYNTCMDILSSGARALVWPFSEESNDEQTLRARKLERLGHVSVLDPGRLEPGHLAGEILRCLDLPAPQPVTLDLHGARRTAELIAALVAGDINDR